MTYAEAVQILDFVRVGGNAPSRLVDEALRLTGDLQTRIEDECERLAEAA